MNPHPTEVKVAPTFHLYKQSKKVPMLLALMDCCSSISPLLLPASRLSAYLQGRFWDMGQP